MPSGSFLHTLRPDGSDLRAVALPTDCSPERFTRDGRVLTCLDLAEDADLEHFEYAVDRRREQWHRVPMPAETDFPEWADPLGSENVDAPQWAPAMDRIAFVRNADLPVWFSSTGKIAVAEADGSNERAVATDGEAPQWSPDGKRLAFTRCRVSDEWLKEEFADPTAECSLWTVPVETTGSAQLLAKGVASEPVWSPDGRFVAFLGQSGACESFCRYRIVVVPSSGGESQEVGPELVAPTGDPPYWWTGLAWLPAAAPAVAASVPGQKGDALELQRCVDIWNRARMNPWPTGAVNVRRVGGRCQVTVSDYGGICEQSDEMPFRYWCPSHGAGLHMIAPDFRVWNAYGDEDGTITLFDAPKGPRLPLPKAPPHPMLGGYVIPYGKGGRPLPDLTLTKVEGTCYGTGEPDRYPLAYPDGYPARCWWHGSGSEECFKHQGRLAIGDVVLCPGAAWDEAYDPLRFFEVRVASIE